MNGSTGAEKVLNAGLPAFRQRLDAKPIAALSAAFREHSARFTGAVDEHRDLVLFLMARVDAALAERNRLEAAFRDFTQRFGASEPTESGRGAVLAFCRQLGATRRQLFADRRAFAHFFGADAATDRYENRLASVDRDLSLCLDRLGYALAAAIGARRGPAYRLRQWQELALEEQVLPLLSYRGDARVQQAAFQCLSRAIRALPEEARERALSGRTLRAVYRSSLQRSLSVWIQAAALDLLGDMSKASFERAVSIQLQTTDAGDGLFVRARAVRLAMEHIAGSSERNGLASLAALDPSPFVRQAVADCLPSLPDAAADALLRTLVDDAVPAVVARTLSVMPGLANTGRRALFLEVLRAKTASDQPSLVTRHALAILVAIHRALRLSQNDPGADFEEEALNHIRDLRVSDPRTRVRRWASRAGEEIWAQADDARATLKEELASALSDLQPGQRKRLPVSLVQQVSATDLGRILALLALDDHGFDVEFTARHLHVYRGNVFRLRLWRLLFEWRNSATDKRQGFRHTVGRHFHGTLLAPSTVLCEQARTKVPGEPLFIDDEDGWRPFLPLLDNVLGALDRGLPVDAVQLVSTEGVTEILPPLGWRRRFRARWLLSRRFPELAALRNWRPGTTGHGAGDYVRALQELGFRIRFRPHDWHEGTEDDRVSRFFPTPALALPLPLFLLDMTDRGRDYFYSLYQNTLGHLAVFLAAGAALFFGSHLRANRRILRARRSIALSLGGWGTRGKSGTERLKAGLMNALGYGLVSKTTGCEAMFIFSRPFGRAREMFLFRPYDKATIWEQANLLSLAQKLRSEVFLWECMALTPSFVEILQRQWMRDDYATITNTYPDHEDIQGPAGINIPEVIGKFIPTKSCIVTSEESMLPVLRSEAHRVGTSLYAVGWQESLQLAPDILDRFPYEEHPYNIALVTRLANLLEIPVDFALKEMADRVIPDLGVLKAFPRAPVRGRVVEFINGMSANERFGSLGNFSRVGFDAHDPVSEPGVWLATVVNNRADRVARSKVFAAMLVDDVSADAHLLIGTNLKGFVSYLDEAWDSSFAAFSLDSADEPAGRVDAVTEWFKKFRIPFDAPRLSGRKGSLPDHPESAAWSDRFNGQHRAARALLDEAADPGVATDALEKRLLQQLRSWFDEKIIVVADSLATGEQVVDRLVAATPPGFFARVMGMQNIKGTGLDFMYRWLAWETVADACGKLRSGDARRNLEGLTTLIGFQEYGLLCEETLRDTLREIRSGIGYQSDTAQAQLNVIESAFEEAVREVHASIGDQETEAGAESGGWIDWLITGTEQFLDSFDAVRRRRRANLIYRELASERIAPERASLELQQLNKRQKGGWLRQLLGRR